MFPINSPQKVSNATTSSKLDVLQSQPIDFKHGLLKYQNTLTMSHHILGQITHFLTYIHHIRTNEGDEKRI